MPGNEVKRYGFYRCEVCEKTWESANAYCSSYSNQPLYKQDCKDCNVGVLPYRTEPLKCSRCGEVSGRCVCDNEDRHNDPNKPHRQDLCEKCRQGNPCGGRY